MATAVPTANVSTGGGRSDPTEHLTKISGATAAQERDLETRFAAAQERQMKPAIMAMASMVKVDWQKAQRAKDKIEQELLQEARQRKGEYDPAKLQAIAEEGGTKVFMPLTAAKCRAFEAWIDDILMGVGTDRPWTLDPTPIPELPDDRIQEIVNETMRRLETGEVQETDIFDFASDMTAIVEDEMEEDARLAADRMAKKIEDQFVEANFKKVFEEFLTDIGTYKSGFIKGPMIRRRPKAHWAKDENGRTVQEISDELRFEFMRVSPFDMYPSSESAGIDDGYLFHRMKMKRHDLQTYKGVPGFDDDAIDLALMTYRDTGSFDWIQPDQQRSEVEDRPLENVLGISETFEVLEYWGRLQGTTLASWGTKVEDLMEEYHVCIWIVGSFVIRAVINPDKLGRRPFVTSSYEYVPGSFWGKGVPERMRSVQQITNAAIRALVNNLGWASGPQVAINDVDRLAPGEKLTTMKPGKIWQFTNEYQASGKPIEFFQPDPMITPLLQLFERIEKMADDHTGIPAYAHGNPELQGAGGTASGLSMLMNSAARGIKKVIGQIGMDVIIELVRRQFELNMRYLMDETMKGDVEVNPRGALGLIMQEQVRMRRNEFLAITNNPTDAGIIGPRRRMNVYREVASGLDMNVNDVIPTDEELRVKEEQFMIAQAMQEQEQIGAPEGAPV